jgi:hypothetical protein
MIVSPTSHKIASIITTFPSLSTWGFGMPRGYRSRKAAREAHVEGRIALMSDTAAYALAVRFLSQCDRTVRIRRRTTATAVARHINALAEDIAGLDVRVSPGMVCVAALSLGFVVRAIKPAPAATLNICKKLPTKIEGLGT